MGPSLLREFKLNEIVNWSVLRFAEESEAWESVERLLTSGASERELIATKRKLQNLKDAGRVASEMCRHGCQRLLKFALTECPSLLEAQLPQRRTLLHIAAEAGSSIAVRCLVDAKANVNARDERGVTPLHEAAAHCNYYVLLLLLKAGANASATDEGGRTALHYAARGGSVSAIQVLLSEGLRADTASASGWTPLHEAAGGPNPQCVFLLMEAGIDKLATTASGWTALHAAARSGTSRAVRILLDAGIPVDAKTLEEETALHFAAERGATEIVTMLAEAGAHLEAVDKSGRTPSRRAAERQIKEQVAAAKPINEDACRQQFCNANYTERKDCESEPEDTPTNVTETTADIERDQSKMLTQEETTESPLIVPSYDSEVSYGDDRSEYSYLSGESYSDSGSDTDSELDAECPSVDTASEMLTSYEHLPFTPIVQPENPHSNDQKRPYTPRGKYYGRGRGNFRIHKSASRESGLEHSQEKEHHQQRTKNYVAHHHERGSSTGNIHKKRQRHRHRQRQAEEQQQQKHVEPHLQNQKLQKHRNQHQQQSYHHQQQLPHQEYQQKKQYKQFNQKSRDSKPNTAYKNQNSGDNGKKMEYQTPHPANTATRNMFGQNRQEHGSEWPASSQFSGLDFSMGIQQSIPVHTTNAQNRSQRNTGPPSVVDELERLKNSLASIAPGTLQLQKGNQKQ